MNKRTQPGGWAKSVNSALPRLVAPPGALPSTSTFLLLPSPPHRHPADWTRVWLHSTGARTVWGRVYPCVTSRKAGLERPEAFWSHRGLGKASSKTVETSLALPSL